MMEEVKDTGNQGSYGGRTQAQEFKMIPPEGDLEGKAFPHLVI